MRAFCWCQATVVNHGMSFCIIVFHTLCLKCFMVFRCKEFPDGNSYMVFAPEVLYNNSPQLCEALGMRCAVR